MENTLPTRRASRLASPAGLIGAGVLVASLGAAAGWMMRASNAPGEHAVQQLALAPNETVVPRDAGPVASPSLSPAQGAAPQAAMPPVPAHAQRQTPRTVQRHAPSSGTPAPERTEQGSAAGSGTSGAAPLETRRAAVCDNCGVIEGVRAVQQKGEGTGMGAVGGAVLGGVLGHQVGGGNGRNAMTVLGTIGGGLAGHEVEKRMRAKTVYEVRVRLDDGSLRTFTRATAPTPGARVVVEGSSFRTVSSRNSGGAGDGQGV